MRINGIRVLFFATLRDRAGVKAAELEIPLSISVAEFKQLITQGFPSLQESMAHCLVAVNHEYVFDADVIPLGAEVAVFPPVSGG